MVSASLVERLIADVKVGRRTHRQEVEEMRGLACTASLTLIGLPNCCNSMSDSKQGIFLRGEERTRKLAYDQPNCSGLCDVC